MIIKLCVKGKITQLCGRILTYPCHIGDIAVITFNPYHIGATSVFKLKPNQLKKKSSSAIYQQIIFMQ